MEDILPMGETIETAMTWIRQACIYAGEAHSVPRRWPPDLEFHCEIGKWLYINSGRLPNLQMSASGEPASGKLPRPARRRSPIGYHPIGRSADMFCTNDHICILAHRRK